MKNDYTIDVIDGFPVNDGKLFFQQLTQLIACGKYRICLHFNEKSAMAFAREISKYILEEKALKATETKKEFDDLLPQKEVINLIGVSASTLWNWKKKAYLLPVKIGSKVYYRKSDIEKLRKGEQ